jgi:hypothetical protein
VFFYTHNQPQEATNDKGCFLRYFCAHFQTLIFQTQLQTVLSGACYRGNGIRT